MQSQSSGDLQDASAGIAVRVDLAEDQILEKADKTALEAGLSTKVSNKDLTDKLKNYALASALKDYLTVNAAAEMYVTSEGVTSIIGNYIVTDKDGTKKSLAQILADQVAVLYIVNDTTCRLDAKVSNKDLTDKLKNYALASALNDYLSVNAAAEMYVTSEGVTSIIGNYIVTDKDGTKKSLAQILADVISLQGRVDLTGALSVKNGVITSTGQIVSEKNIRANTGLSSTKLELDTADITIAQKSYTPTEITSIYGTVLVLGIA